MLRIASLITFFSLLARAAEEAAAQAEPSIVYKWINFGILAVALVYLIAKFLMPVLRARAVGIEKDISASKATVAVAQAKVAELSAKLGNFETAIRNIREKAMAEREIEANRIADQTQQLLVKVSIHGQTEIANLTQTAQLQLRAFTVERAIDIARTRLASKTDPTSQNALIGAFLDDLKRQEAR